MDFGILKPKEFEVKPRFGIILYYIYDMHVCVCVPTLLCIIIIDVKT